jgi:hypothetical protein
LHAPVIGFAILLYAINQLPLQLPTPQLRIQILRSQLAWQTPHPWIEN